MIQEVQKASSTTNRSVVFDASKTSREKEESCNLEGLGVVT